MAIDLEKIKTLIAEATDPVLRQDLGVLAAGWQKTRREYNEIPSAANLANWQAVEKALQKKIDAIEGAAGAGKSFASISEVLDYLEAAGWKVTKTSLYRHINKERKLLPRADGSFAQAAVDKYALAHLKQKATGKKVSVAMDNLQQKKLEQELKNLELAHRRQAFLQEKDEGKYIPREQMDIELAARAGILDAGLKHWIQSRSADWIRTAGGDTKKVGELINQMSRELDEHINSYASTREFQVIIDVAAEEADDGEEAKRLTGEEDT